MKVAIVSSVPAFPATAGNRERIRQLAHAVQRLGHELTFVLVSGRNTRSDDGAHEAAFGKENYVRIETRRTWGEYVRRKLLRRVQKILRYMGVETGYYSMLDQDYSRCWTARIAEIGRDVDAVIVEYVFNSRVFEAFPESTRRLLDTHDAFADRHKSYVSRGLKNGYWKSLRAQDENIGFRRADIVIAIQHEEAENFRRQLAGDGGATSPQVAVVSHLLDLGGAIDNYDADRSAIFLGSDNPSNRQAVDDFIRRVLPLVVRQAPDFDLKLVGSICDHIPDTPNVTKLGRVADLRAAFSRAPLLVNPMLLGTGINIKVLDAMAAGVPVVSTETGVRGLPVQYRNGVFVVPDRESEAFADEIARLSGDVELRRQAGHAAFRDAESWNAEQLAELRRCLS